MFACILLSFGYIKQELSYDYHHSNADRIVRLSLQFNNEAIDGRIWGNALDDVLLQMPEVDRIAKMFKISNAFITYQGNHHAVNDFYSVTREFLHIFDIPLISGNKGEVLQQRDQVLVSESFARKLFGELNIAEFKSSEILIEGQSFFISGIFEDIPTTSHFHTDILLHRSDDKEAYTYTYLLLKDNPDIHALEQKITNFAGEKEFYKSLDPRAHLMPLTDIHLHSHNLREMSINGNIYYIYLITGANILLLIIVLFNLWLNMSLTFSHNRRYYQILRLHGAPSSAEVKDETLLALIWGFLSIFTGSLIAYCISLFTPRQIDVIEMIVLCLMFLLLVIVVSIFPALKGVSTTLFFNKENDLKSLRFSYSNVKWMLTIQYAIVMIVVILAFGINKQMNLVKAMQVGGDEQHILVMNDQPDQIRANYELLKTELLKYSEIDAVTTAFQVPGDAIRDIVQVRNESVMNWQSVPIIIVGEDFLPFFNIKMIVGQEFSPLKYNYKTEEEILSNRLQNQEFSKHIEEYIINRKALSILGFRSPEDAIGKILQIEHNTVNYFTQGIIVGVTDDFNYTGLYEETIPLLMMQRCMFQYCIMVRLSSDNFIQGRNNFEKVWNKVYPGYSADYTFMNDVFDKKYHNEVNAQQLVYIFSLLCFGIADLGLIVFMAFIIRRRTREIVIRKIHGATVSEIIKMLNVNLIRYIVLAFVISIPIAWYIMDHWLERFAYRTSLDWWLFALAGFAVLLISFASVSLQSWHAATKNPVDAITNS